jgi:hypothetical protein
MKCLWFARYCTATIWAFVLHSEDWVPRDSPYRWSHSELPRMNQKMNLFSDEIHVDSVIVDEKANIIVWICHCMGRRGE